MSSFSQPDMMKRPCTAFGCSLLCNCKGPYSAQSFGNIRTVAETHVHILHAWHNAVYVMALFG